MALQKGDEGDHAWSLPGCDPASDDSELHSADCGIGCPSANIAQSRPDIAIFHYFPNKDALFIALAERDAEHRARLWRTHGLGAVAHAIGDEDPDWLNTYAELSRRVRHDPDFRQQWERRGAPLNQG